MISITDIPLDDIELFLSENYIEIPKTVKESYNLAENLILNSKINYYPNSIVDWIIAYNFYRSGHYVKSYSKEEILALTDDELSILAGKLGLDIISIKSIINILFYLGKLKETKRRSYLDLTIIPELNIKIIAYTDLKTLIDNLKLDGSIRSLIYQAIPELLYNNITDQNAIIDFIVELGEIKEFKLLKRIIEELSILEPEEQYLKYLDYDTLIELFKYNKSVRDLIYDALPAIVDFYYQNNQPEKGEDNKLNYLISKLDDMKEFELMKKLIEESNKIYPILNQYKNGQYDLYRTIIIKNKFLSPDTPIDLMEKYLELSQNYHWINYGGLGGVRDLKPILDKLKYFFRRLVAATKAKSINLLIHYIRSWKGERQNWIYSANRMGETMKENILEYINKIDELIEEAEIIVKQ